MDLQTTPLADLVQYYLDGAIEYEEINGATHATLYLFGDRNAVAEIVNTPHEHGWKARMPICDRLDHLAFEMIMKAPADLRDALLAVGLRSGFHQAKSSAECLAWWNFEDSLVGGCRLPWRKTWRCNEAYTPFAKTERRLRSPRAIRRYVKRNSEDMVPFQRRRAARFRDVMWPSSGASGLLTALYTEQGDAIRRRQASDLRFQAELAKRRVGQAPQRKERKSIMRAAAFAVSLLGASFVSDFVHGKPVEIAGSAMTFQVAKAGNIGKVGHGALDITVMTPDRVPLCKLCFYIDSTPTLDQLAAIKMFVESGEENEIFTTGNLFAITKEGYEHPLLAERTKKDREAIEAVQVPGPFIGASDYELRRQASLMYSEGMVDLYLDPLLTLTWGRDAARLKRFAT